MLQGLDASGKDGVVRSVFTGVNPQGCRVVSFKAPSSTSSRTTTSGACTRAARARRDRHLQPLALRGRRRRPDAASSRRRRSGAAGRATSASSSGCSSTRARRSSRCSSRLEGRAGKRLQERIDNPEKRWKFRRDDLDVREQFDDYIAAYEDALTETSTEWAPWYVVPADRNWVKALAVAELLVDTLEKLDPKLPAPEAGIEELRVK